MQGEYTLGALAMANAGPNTNGSQFFMCIDDCTRKLTKDYNLFGYVVEGIDVAQATQVGDVMQSVVIEETRRDRLVAMTARRGDLRARAASRGGSTPIR